MADTENRREKLDALIKRRDTLKAKKGRVEGQLEEARKTLVAVEDECRKRKVPPDQLGAAIKSLEKRHDEAVEAVAKDITGAEEALAPFMEEPHADSSS